MDRPWTRIGRAALAGFYSYAAAGTCLLVAARALGPSGFGTLSAALAIAVLLSTLGHLSIGQVLAHRAVAARQEGAAEALGLVVGLALAATLGGALLLAGVHALMQPELLQRMPAALLSLSVALVPFLVLEQGLSPLLSVRGLVESFNLAQVAGRTTLLAGTVLVAAAGAGPSAFLAAQVAGQSVSGLLCAAALLRHDGFRWPAARSVGRVLGVSLQLHPAALGSFFIVWLNAILVSRQAGFAAAGQYQAAWSGIQLLLTLPQGAMLVLFSHIGTRGVDGAWRADRLKVAAGVVGMSALAAAASPAVPWAVQMVFGASYGPAVAIVRTLLWTVPGATLSLLMTPQWIGRGLFAATSCLTLGVGLVGGAASLWLIPQRGAQGAALSSVGAFAAVLLIQSAFALWLNRRVRRQPAATTA